MSPVPEPEIRPGDKPERAFETQLIAALRERLDASRVQYLMLRSFGLDIAVFLRSPTGVRTRFIEAKAFVGGRPGGVGFGSPRGEGAQIDLLWDQITQSPRSPDGLQLMDDSIRWVLMDGTKSFGTARFALFTCSDAQSASMGGVRPGKQNNLRISGLEKEYRNWNVLVDELTEFIVD